MVRSAKHGKQSEAKPAAALAEDSEVLDRVFFALSDPVRRSILDRLSAGPLLVSELAAPFDISLQAVSRHTELLVQAGLVKKERTGRISRCSLDAGPIYSAAVWVNRYSKYWQDQFNLLAATLERLDRERRAPHTKPGHTQRAKPRRSGR